MTMTMTTTLFWPLLAHVLATSVSALTYPSQSVGLSVTTATKVQDDVAFDVFCREVGLELTHAYVSTTPDSVAGRGVFGASKVKEGTAVMRIPAQIVLCEPTAARFFPKTNIYLDDRRRMIMEKFRVEREGRQPWRRLIRHFWPFQGKNIMDGTNDIVSRLQGHQLMEFVDEEDWWQMELTMYAFKCLEQGEEHPWATWISQWKRDDPMQQLYEQGTTCRNVKAVESCVERLHEMLPEASKVKLAAAVDIRLRRLEALKLLFGVEDVTLDAHYGLVTSRAIELGDENTPFAAVIPGFDMINHSPNPNLVLSYDEDTDHFELVATRDIAESEEFFLKYTRPGTGQLEDNSWDEESAIWTLIQWGIPESTKQ